MNVRTIPPLLVALCLLLAGCAGFAADDTSPTPTATQTPDDGFDLRVENDRAGTVAVRAWFVTGSLDGVVVTAANGTNATYAVDELRGRPVAVGNVSAVTPVGDVGRSVGIRLSGGVDGVVKADAAGAESVVYAVLSVDSPADEETADGGPVRAGGDERVEFVGVGTCSGGGSVVGMTVTVGDETTSAVACEE